MAREGSEDVEERHLHGRKEVVSSRSRDVPDPKHLEGDDGVLGYTELVEDVYGDESPANSEQHDDDRAVPREGCPAPGKGEREGDDACGDEHNSAEIDILEGHPRTLPVRDLLHEEEQDGDSWAGQYETDPKTPPPVDSCENTAENLRRYIETAAVIHVISIPSQ